MLDPTIHVAVDSRYNIYLNLTHSLSGVLFSTMHIVFFNNRGSTVLTFNDFYGKV